MTNRFYSTHQLGNGVISTVEIIDDGTLGVRIQGEDEKMLVDIAMGSYEALCLAQSILSVVINQRDEIDD